MDAILRGEVALELDRKLFEVEKAMARANAEQMAAQEATAEAQRAAADAREAQAQVDAARAALEAEKMAWSKAKRCCEVDDLGERVTLNVGGRKFTTLKSTLQNAQGMLGGMFSGKFKVLLDEEGCVFLDRDGDMFHVILEMVRNGDRFVPPAKCDLAALSTEMEFFSLPPFIASVEVSLDRPQNDEGVISFAQNIYTLESEYSFLRHSFVPGIQNTGGVYGIHFSPRVFSVQARQHCERLRWPIRGIFVFRVISNREGVKDKMLGLNLGDLESASGTKLLNGACIGDNALISSNEAGAFFDTQDKLKLFVEFHPQ